LRVKQYSECIGPGPAKNHHLVELIRYRIALPGIIGETGSVHYLLLFSGVINHRQNNKYVCNQDGDQVIERLQAVLMNELVNIFGRDTWNLANV
jgi:hypothetical protein